MTAKLTAKKKKTRKASYNQARTSSRMEERVGVGSLWYNRWDGAFQVACQECGEAYVAVAAPRTLAQFDDVVETTRQDVPAMPNPDQRYRAENIVPKSYEMMPHYAV